jgi:hypothetical protein
VTIQEKIPERQPLQNSQCVDLIGSKWTYDFKVEFYDNFYRHALRILHEEKLIPMSKICSLNKQAINDLSNCYIERNNVRLVIYDRDYIKIRIFSSEENVLDTKWFKNKYMRINWVNKFILKYSGNRSLKTLAFTICCICTNKTSCL